MPIRWSKRLRGVADMQSVFRWALAIRERADAEEFLAAYVNEVIRPYSPGISEEEAFIRARDNLAYIAANYGDVVRERFERLFDAYHPVFGALDDWSDEVPMNSTIALYMGLRVGNALARGRPATALRPPNYDALPADQKRDIDLGLGLIKHARTKNSGKPVPR